MLSPTSKPTTYTLTVTEHAVHLDLSPYGYADSSREAYEAVSAWPVAKLVARFADVSDGERDKAARVRWFRSLPKAVKAAIVAEWTMPYFDDLNQ